MKIVRADVGTLHYVTTDDGFVIEHFDDVEKAKRFLEEMRKTDNDRLLTLQEEAIQTAERSSSLDKEREEEVRGYKAIED